ncbi:MAG: nickel-responsive transcriptional regulator NikR [Armatimonadota bacterium]|nr:nickel-responsive transcriptional regulator NikR [Armatimonadota bacterium]
MSTVERFGVSMEAELLSRFDSMIEARGYKTRSEAIRDLIRQELVRQEWQDPNAEVVGTITVVYDHHHYELAEALTDIQHKFHAAIICSTHVHLDEHNCLEVVIAKGSSVVLRSIADALISMRGVKHGQLVSTTTGRTLA